jgi:ribosomal protein L37AE/L43A
MNDIEEKRRHLMSCEKCPKDVQERIKTASARAVDITYACHWAISHENDITIMELG